jgi:hypothetical protein
VGTLLRRHDLRLDVPSRTWTRRKGFWPVVATQVGTFHDLDGLILAIEVESVRRFIPIPHWVIRLDIRGDRYPVGIADFRDERTAYRRLESLATTLQLDAIDRTGERDTRIPWQAINRPIVSRTLAAGGSIAVRASAVPPLPEGSAIQVFGAAPAIRIVLPPPPWGAVFAVSLVFVPLGSLFVAFGALLWLNRVPGEGSAPDLTYLLVPIFILLGVAIILFLIDGSIRRQEFQNRGDEMLFGYRVLGRLTRRQRLDKRSIEEIAVKPGREGNLGPHLFVRSPQRLLHVGRTIERPELEWLRLTLISWLSANRPGEG